MSQVQDRIFTREFILLAIGVHAFFLSFFMLNPTLPFFIEAHGGSKAMIGALVGGSSMVSLILRPFTGRWVDRHGRTPFLALGAGLLALSAIGYTVVFSIPILWIVRLTAGAGISLFLTASLAYMADVAPAKRRGAAFGYFGVFQTLGIAFGPPLGLWLMDSGMLAGLEQHAERFMLTSGAKVGGGNFALVFLATFAFAAVGFIVTRRLRESRAPTTARAVKLPWSQTMFDPVGLLPGGCSMLLTMNTVALNVFIPLYGREIGVGNAGFYFTCSAGAVILSRLLGGPLLDRYPRVFSIIPALGACMAGTFMIGLISEAWVLYPAGIIIGLGQGIAQPGLQAMLVDRAKKERVGAATATFNMGADIGLGAGGFIMGLIATYANYSTMFVAAALGSGLAMAILAVATARYLRAGRVTAAAS